MKRYSVPILLAVGGVLWLQPAGAASVLDTAAKLTYCGANAIKRQISFRINKPTADGWDAVIKIVGQPEIRAMTAYSYFGNQKPLPGFIVALLGEDRSELLIFSKNNRTWIEFGDYQYKPCKNKE